MLMRPYRYTVAGWSNTYSLDFDGVDEFVEASAPTMLNSCVNASISGWFKFDVVASGMRVCGGYKDASNQFGPSLFSSNIGFVFNASAYCNSTSTTLVTGTWYHIVCIYDGGGATNADKLKIYINDSQETLSFTGTMPSSLSSSFATGGYFRIGQRDGNAAYDMNGHGDEVALFDYSLSGSQVSNIYNSGSPTDLDDTSGVTAPEHWWRCGDGSDTISTIYDVGDTGGYNGTPQNMEAGDIVADVP